MVSYLLVSRVLCSLCGPPLRSTQESRQGRLCQRHSGRRGPPAQPEPCTQQQRPSSGPGPEYLHSWAGTSGPCKTQCYTVGDAETMHHEIKPISWSNIHLLVVIIIDNNSLYEIMTAYTIHTSYMYVCMYMHDIMYVCLIIALLCMQPSLCGL